MSIRPPPNRVLRTITLVAELAALATGSCGGASDDRTTSIASAAAVATGVVDLATVEIVLERTTCYGWCPSYVVTISGDGAVRYHGRNYVREVGDRVGHVGEESVRELLTLFEHARFFELNDRYDAEVTDVPAKRITLRRDGRTKRVENEWSSAFAEESPDVEIHRRLDALADAIDRTVGIDRWIGTEAEQLSAPEHFRVMPFDEQGK
jgi:hypothetical protein